ncbi:MAG: hypothetical protein WC712_06255 [Candidatus Brocadiia bacterium]
MSKSYQRLATAFAIAVVVSAVWPRNCRAESFSYPPTGFKLELPAGWVVDASARAEPPPESFFASPKPDYAAINEGKLLASWLRKTEGKRYARLQVFIGCPTGEMDDMMIASVENELISGIKRTIHDYVPLDYGGIKLNGYQCIRMMGCWGKDPRFEGIQYILGDAKASYMIVFAYDGADSSAIRPEAERIAGSVGAGEPYRKEGSHMLLNIIAIFAVLFAIYFVASKVIAYRKSSAALALLLAAAVTLALPSLAAAETAQFGSRVKMIPPTGYAEDAPSKSAEDVSQYFGTFPREFYPYVKYLMPEEFDENDPVVDEYKIMLYPIPVPGAKLDTEEFEKQYVKFNKLANYKRESIKVLDNAGNPFIRFTFTIESVFEAPLSSVVYARVAPFGFIVYEVSAPAAELKKREADYVKSFLSVEVTGGAELLSFAEGSESTREIPFIMIVGAAILVIALALLVVAFLRRRKNEAN